MKMEWENGRFVYHLEEIKLDNKVICDRFDGSGPISIGGDIGDVYAEGAYNTEGGVVLDDVRFETTFRGIDGIPLSIEEAIDETYEVIGEAWESIGEEAIWGRRR